MKIKTISLWQPHASLIAFGEKPFETRSWPVKHRGLLAIHATKTEEHFLGADEDFAFAHAFNSVSEKHNWGEWYWPPINRMVNDRKTGVQHGLGAILGVCDVLDCCGTNGNGQSAVAWARANHQIDFREFPHAGLFGDFGAGRYAWLLTNVRRFREPIAATGRQGLWYWDAPEDFESLLVRP